MSLRRRREPVATEIALIPPRKTGPTPQPRSGRDKRKLPLGEKPIMDVAKYLSAVSSQEGLPHRCQQIQEPESDAKMAFENCTIYAAYDR